RAGRAGDRTGSPGDKAGCSPRARLVLDHPRPGDSRLPPGKDSAALPRRLDPCDAASRLAEDRPRPAGAILPAAVFRLSQRRYAVAQISATTRCLGDADL